MADPPRKPPAPPPNPDKVRIAQLEGQLYAAQNRFASVMGRQRWTARLEAMRAPDLVVPAKPALIVPAFDAAKPRKLRAIHANAGDEAWYRRRLEREIDEMAASVLWWTRAAYRRELERIMASDAAPADLLQQVLDSLRQRWGTRFDALGEEIAEKFADRAGATVDDAIEAAMRAAGIRVKLQTTRKQDDQLAGAIRENVSLIRSIPEQYLTDVEGAVMRSVRAGRDLRSLVDELQHQHAVTFDRAALIARDQNNKATAFLTRTRQDELGIEEAQWVHSGAGRKPRPTHVRAGRDKVVYNVREGWLDPAIGKRIWPGTEINCRCTCRSIIPALLSKEAA